MANSCRTVNIEHMGFKGRVIGLTGNIACGKSTVAKLFAELGVPIVDADQVAKDITKRGTPLLTEIVRVFGPGVLDSNGDLNRKVVRDSIFKSPAGRKALESILHPAIREKSAELINEHFEAGKATVIYEAALIVEAGRSQDFDGLLVVTCDEVLQKQRLAHRDQSITAELAQRMIAAQMSAAEKASFATWTIENNGSLEDLRTKVRTWYETNITRHK